MSGPVLQSVFFVILAHSGVVDSLMVMGPGCECHYCPSLMAITSIFMASSAMASKDIDTLNNDTSDDRVVASYVPPRY